MRLAHHPTQRASDRVALDVVVVGAGGAGLACAAELQRTGHRVAVLERGSSAGQSWLDRYDRLRLNTSRPFSKLLRKPYSAGTPMFPSRKQVVEYLERFARDAQLDVRFGVEVQRIDRDFSGWSVRAAGATYRAPHVVVATGAFREPYIPDWPGRSLFRGELIHSAEYRNAERFAGRRVLVVGPGSSGMEIAYDLLRGGAKDVRLAVRTPPNILLRTVGGAPGDPAAQLLLHLPPRLADRMLAWLRQRTLGDLTAVGLPVPSDGPFERLHRTGQGPAVVDREVIDAIRAREIAIVPALEAFEEHAVRLRSDGGAAQRLEIDAVIAATGFGTGLEPLVGHLGVLDEQGMPRVRSGEEAAPGLRFVGFRPVPALFVEVSRQARAIARTIQAAHDGPQQRDSADRATQR